jgi:hypothetical protein
MLVEERANGAVVLQQLAVDERQLGDQGERIARLSA